jgi:hypothetical protein
MENKPSFFCSDYSIASSRKKFFEKVEEIRFDEEKLSKSSPAMKAAIYNAKNKS